MAASVGGTDPHAALDCWPGSATAAAVLHEHRQTRPRSRRGRLGIEVPMMTAEIGPGRPVAYFDVCVFGPDDRGLADEVERRASETSA